MVQAQTPEGELYVHRIEELHFEIRQAMAAISGNELQSFEESLWRQEVLCIGLKHLLSALQEYPPGSRLHAHLQASMRALFELNQSYAELLRQAKAANQSLYALCLSTGGSTQERAASSTRTCSLEA